jgi:hypothetical protein
MVIAWKSACSSALASLLFPMQTQASRSGSSGSGKGLTVPVYPKCRSATRSWSRAAIPGSLAAYLLYQILWSMAVWSWLIFILYFGMRLLNTDNKVIHYGNEAVLPFYVLHYSVILLTTFYVVQLNIGVGIKLLLVSTCSLLVTLALYELFIRRINALRFLFGMKPRTRVVHGDVDLQEHTA